MKRGTCTNCGRPDIGLVSGGHCSACYTARQGLRGAEKAQALAAARRRIGIKAIRAAERKRGNSAPGKEAKPGTFVDILKEFGTSEEHPTPPQVPETPPVADLDNKILSIHLDSSDLTDAFLAALKEFAQARRFEANAISLLEVALSGRRASSEFKELNFDSEG